MATYKKTVVFEPRYTIHMTLNSQEAEFLSDILCPYDDQWWHGGFFKTRLMDPIWEQLNSGSHTITFALTAASQLNKILERYDTDLTRGICRVITDAIADKISDEME